MSVCVFCNVKFSNGERPDMSVKLWEGEEGATEVPREEKSIPGSKHGLCKGPGAVRGGQCV